MPVCSRGSTRRRRVDPTLISCRELECQIPIGGWSNWILWMSQTWAAAQNALTRKYLDVVPQRAKIDATLKSFGMPSVAPPLQIGSTFYLISKGSLFSGADEKSPTTLLVDILTLTGNPKAAITDMNVSPDGKRLRCWSRVTARIFQRIFTSTPR